LPVVVVVVVVVVAAAAAAAAAIASGKHGLPKTDDLHQHTCWKLDE
jgi:hypothetical protein